jgi:hypothetical protein
MKSKHEAAMLEIMAKPVAYYQRSPYWPVAWKLFYGFVCEEFYVMTVMPLFLTGFLVLVA